MKSQEEGSHPLRPKTRIAAPLSGLRVLAAAAAVAVVLASGSAPVWSQITQAAGANAPHALFITILEGDNALNNIRQRDAREPVIQVTDENHRPVAGVAILFLIHGGPNGAGASFPGGSSSLSVTTGADGTAHASGMQLANAPGSFTITVSASLGSLVATAVIHQASVISALSTATESGSATSGTSGTTGNVAGTVARHGILHLSKAVLIGTGVVAGTVVGVVVATKANSSTSLTLGGTRIGP